MNQINVNISQNKNSISAGIKNVVPINPAKGTFKINENGKFNVKEFEFADVNVVNVNIQKKSLTISKNGSYNILPDENYFLEKASVNVNVPIPEGYVKPSGTLNIEENDIYDVKNYEKVNVEVPIPSGYIKPEGTIEITENGEVDVTEYKKANVSIDNAILKAVVSRTITKITAKDLEGLTSIGDYAFYGCKINEVELPNTITSMGRNCFQGNLFEEFVIPDSVITISLYVFQGCTNLKKITIGNNVTGFGNGVFDGCTGLTYIEVPDSVKSIAWYVFQRCSNLAKLKLGRGITSISGCFSGCNALKEIIILAENPPRFDAQNLTQLPADCIFKVPADSVDAYKNFTNWSARADYIIAYEGD